MIHAGIYGADGVVFDLEDSIAAGEKDEARLLLEEMLPVIQDALDEQGILCRIAIRINALDTPWWKADVESSLKAGARILRVPKIESPREIEELSMYLAEVEFRLGLQEGSTTIQALMETPRGVEQAFAIGDASPRVVAFSFGAEDYSAAIGVRRKEATLALDYPRARIASAAAACHVEAYDSVWGFLDDPKGLAEDAARAHALGFHGKSTIHPNQIATIHTVFSYSPQELQEAQRIMDAVAQDDAGVMSSFGRMIDKPVVAWAAQVLKTSGSSR
jgi:citrate lyase subunit beta/citryl-CoA lyase